MPAKSAKHEAIPADARNWEVENDREEVSLGFYSGGSFWPGWGTGTEI